MKRMNQWEAGMIPELVQDTVADMTRRVGGIQPSKDNESITRKYHSMVIEEESYIQMTNVRKLDDQSLMCFARNILR